MIGLVPFLALGPVGIAVYLALPVYMVHQYEEHDADRFRAFVNALMPGRAGLSLRDVAVINLVGVWALLLATLWLTEFVSDGWGALAFYLLGINALLHVGQAVAFRQYNPGLVTALVLFLPLSALLWVRLAGEASVIQHGASALFILGLHISILLRARRPATNPTVTP
ncbi:MAG: HXXEE domain-containing protein [Pseudomonadota bacterium]